MLARNPLEAWTAAHFEEPIVMNGLPAARVAVVNEPAAIRHVLLENWQNYKKDWLQRRVLSAGLTDGLLSAEGAQWRTQRRALAPLFSRRSVMNFSAAMAETARLLVERLKARDGEIVDLVAEVTRVTLEVLERTIFSDGLGRNPEQFRVWMKSYFETIGRIDILDVLGVSSVVPRPGHWKMQRMLRNFEAAIDQIISVRRSRLARNPDSMPQDILTLLVEAKDPDSGQALSEAEIRANVLTFITAGHETTANSIAWSLFLLSQSAEWQERVRREAGRELDGDIEGLAERLVETRAVVDEAVRLYPPIGAISRAALGPDELAGEPITRGTLVVIAPYVLHRHRTLWTRPDYFDPSRFLNGAREKVDRFAYLPFGAGPRVCIGAAFAL
ncbi:MAG TPA: cytochrome P450, partial [Xanthobacteraceae bacterium]|nr:cytochrome P450 [Xanthobacteraceae bacterium]